MNYSSIYGLIIDLLKYLDDDVVGSFLAFIFDKNKKDRFYNFYDDPAKNKQGCFYNPYDTNKELFLKLAISANADFSSRILDIEEVEKSRAEYYNEVGDDDNYNDYDINVFSYCYLKNCFKEDGYINIDDKKYAYNPDLIESVKDESNLSFLVHLHNMLLIIDEKNILRKCLEYLYDSLNSFDIKLNDIKLRKFYNLLINDLIEHKRIYVIKNKSDYNKEQKLWTLTQVNIENTNFNKDFIELKYIINEDKEGLHIFECEHQIQNYDNFFDSEKIKHYTVMINKVCKEKKANNSHALLSAESESSYFNSINNLNNAINCLKSRNNNRTRCHICQSITGNLLKIKSPMCKDCRDLIKLIRKNKDIKTKRKLAYHKVIYGIKQKNKNLDKNANSQAKRSYYYKNLVNYLNDQNKKIEILNKNDIENQIHKIFNEFPPFSFDESSCI